ncbi:cathepsin K-like [Chironomus tepperi]|uniref:cathepsin K-like n=1 Tax=Chironomus tepperi TaxID=113505 RepID=UPI00391F77BB
MKFLIILSVVICALGSKHSGHQERFSWVRQNIQSNNQIDSSSSSSESDEQSANILKTDIYNPNHCILVPEPNSHELALFRQWALKHSKQYSSEHEKSCRLNNVINKIRENYIHNKKFDQGKVSYRRGLNDFSDLSMQEIRDQILMKKIKSRNFHNQLSELPNLPDARVYVDYREEGLVGPVAQQGMCESCYAWSSAAVLEGQLRKCDIYKNPVSVQNIVDCTVEGSAKCNGGLPYYVFKYQKHGGILPADKYPYLNRNGTCEFSKNDILAYVDKAYGFNFMPVKRRHEDIKKIVSFVGPISVGLCAEESFMAYESGIYDVDNCGDEANHAVTIIGYGTDSHNGDYWLIKNSWGKNWGEEGYGRIAMGKNLCEFESEVYFAQVRDLKGKVCELFDI